MDNLYKCADGVFGVGTLIIVVGLSLPLLDGTFTGNVALSYLLTLVALLSSWTGLYVATLRPFFRKPRLSFSYVVQRSDPTEVESEQGWKRSWFIRLRVVNDGQLPAKNCVGRLIEVKNSHGESIRRFDALSLYWILQDSPGRFAPLDIQGKHDFSFLDLAQIREKENVLTLRVVIPEGHRLPKEVGLPIEPNLPSGTYFLRIGVYSDDAYIIPVWIKIEWWSDFSRDPPCRIEIEDPPSSEQPR